MHMVHMGWRKPIHGCVVFPEWGKPSSSKSTTLPPENTAPLYFLWTTSCMLQTSCQLCWSVSSPSVQMVAWSTGTGRAGVLFLALDVAICEKVVGVLLLEHQRCNLLLMLLYLKNIYLVLANFHYIFLFENTFWAKPLCTWYFNLQTHFYLRISVLISSHK